MNKHFFSDQIIEFHKEIAKNNFQTYAIGLKEVWELKKENTHPGKVFHSIGWPLPNDTYGGSFIYHMEDSLASKTLDSLEVKSEPLQEVLDSLIIESSPILPDSTR